MALNFIRLIGIDEVNDLRAVGRSYADAPEVDGKVYLSDDFDAKPGDLMWIQIIHADEHDVSGWVYQAYGLEACLWISAIFIGLAALISTKLPNQ